MGMPEKIITIIQNMYDGATTRVITPGGLTEPVKIETGVKQECPLRPILFNLAIDRVLRAIRDSRKDTGYKMRGGTRL